MSTPAAEPDAVAAERMWEAYAAAHPDAARAGPEHTADRFGDSVELCQALTALVLAGTKRATAALVEEFLEAGEPLPRVGSHWVACDGTGAPVAVLRSTGLRLATFDEVDEAFAWDEGEDDRSLASWRREHRRYWRRTRAARGATWTEDAPVVLERFRVVWPPEVADAEPRSGGPGGGRGAPG